MLQDEQNQGLAFVNSLTAVQRGKAILQSDKTRDLNLTEAWKDNVVLDYAGLKVSEMTSAQREQLVSLVALYVGNMDDGHARVKMDEVRAHLERTWFAWVGKTEPGSVFYYRIHSPVVLIEFDHQRPIGLRHLLDPNAADHAAHPHGGAHAQRQRLRQGPVAAALRAAPAPVGRSRGSLRLRRPARRAATGRARVASLPRSSFAPRRGLFGLAALAILDEAGTDGRLANVCTNVRRLVG